MILIKLLMVPCLPTPLPILNLNSYTSMVIFVTSSNWHHHKWSGNYSPHFVLQQRFLASHPEILVQKKSDSPDEDKSVHDSRLLIPTLKDFFIKHPLINPKTFLGDAAFDTMELYKALLSGNTFGEKRHFQKAYIPLNIRSGLKNPDYTINENGIPCCPHDATFPMKYECTSKTKNGVVRYKFVCPKMNWIYDNPSGGLTDNAAVKIPVPLQDVAVWSIFIPKKISVLILEQSVAPKNGIIHTKSELLLSEGFITSKSISASPGAEPRMRKHSNAYLILAGITQLITVVLADKINCHKYIRSLKRSFTGLSFAITYFIISYTQVPRADALYCLLTQAIRNLFS